MRESWPCFAAIARGYCRPVGGVDLSCVLVPAAQERGGGVCIVQRMCLLDFTATAAAAAAVSMCVCGGGVSLLGHRQRGAELMVRETLEGCSRMRAGGDPPRGGYCVKDRAPADTMLPGSP
jgi:hypothetical protein